MAQAFRRYVASLKMMSTRHTQELHRAAFAYLAVSLRHRLAQKGPPGFTGFPRKNVAWNSSLF